MDVKTSVLSAHPKQNEKPSSPSSTKAHNQHQQTLLLLTCSMCNEQFQSPRALPCLHTFCKTCLSSYIQTKLSELDTDSFPCPDCNEATQPIDPSRPSTEWADGFPENFFLSDMMDLKEGKTDIIGEIMENDTSAARLISKITLKKSKRLSVSESDLNLGPEIRDLRQEILIMQKTAKIVQSKKNPPEETAALPPTKPTAIEDKPPAILVELSQAIEGQTTTAEDQHTPEKIEKTPAIEEKRPLAQEKTPIQEKPAALPEKPAQEPATPTLEENGHQNGLDILLPLEHQFSAGVPGVESYSMLESAILMPEGFVLGIDCRNRHVKKFTLTGKLVGLLRLVSEPGDIVLLPEGEALLTLPQKCEMISVDPDNSLEITNRLQTPRKYMRLAVGKNEQLVATNCIDNFWFIDVLSYSGRVLYSIQRLCTGNPTGITVSPMNDIIIADSMQRSVIAFNWNGSNYFTYRPDYNSESDENLEDPRGVSCDSKGRIYVADKKNNRIIRLTYDGHAERILLDNTDGLYRPSSIFVSDDSRLLVTQEDGAVKLYKI